ncbi:MAG: penicillin-binding protein 2 [Methylacidiphilales bacterium]|nr:penicillin-binding protein 2 [Candidatus Methylacidiphilales bacterium]
MITDDIRVQGWRLGVLALLVFAAIGLLLSRLWNVQVVNSDSARQRSDEQTTVLTRIAPARGAICDRNGVMLAENRPSFDIDFNLGDLRRAYAEAHKGNVPQLQLRPTKSGKKRSEDDIVEIVRRSIEPIKDTLGLTTPLNEKDIREHFRTEPDLPYHYMSDLDFATVANFEERNLGVTGIQISQNPARQYTYGAFAAHILGYVGTPLNQNEHLASDGTPYDTIGRHGIEAIMDAQLQGEPGSRIQRVSSQGYYIEDKKLEAASQPPTMGSTLYLTIDARVQYIAETAMRHAGVGRGAVVVMDPRNGDVLALVSIPSYDPNKFIPKIPAKDWEALNQDPTAPMFNRALHAYAPGSTYKIMVALAGLKSGNVTVNTPFDCPGAIQIDDHLFHNSDSTDAGTMSLVHAICVSSDVFFYQYGIKAGIEAIDAMGKLAGFGHKWGLLGDADEDAGILPGPEWMKENDKWLVKTKNIDHWSRAQTANTSIGQGFVLTTPLQMATFLCAVANGGTVYQPRIYSRVVDYKGQMKAEIPEGQVYSTLGVKPEDLKAVQEGMREVVEEGTATLAQVPGYQIAGKTGTAQAWIKVNGETRRDLKCWFYCYGPFEAPRYVTCVVVEGGTWGGTTTAPIAQEIMSRLFAMDKGATENLAYLQPALGNFNGASPVVTQTNVNPTQPANATTTATDTTAISANPDNGDTYSNAPMADAPPASARSSNSRTHRH